MLSKEQIEAHRLHLRRAWQRLGQSENDPFNEALCDMALKALPERWIETAKLVPPPATDSVLGWWHKRGSYHVVSFNGSIWLDNEGEMYPPKFWMPLPNPPILNSGERNG